MKTLKRLWQDDAGALIATELTEVPGFPGYAVSEDGKVWSKRGSNGKQWRQLKPIRHGKRYSTVRLWVRGCWFSWYVHRLILTVFKGKGGPDTRHLDGDSSNNRLDNLAWGTRKENMEDTIRLGLVARGNMLPQSKLTENLVVKARQWRRDGTTFQAIANRLGVSFASAYNAIVGDTWRHIPNHVARGPRSPIGR
jgi:hypothetical protein